MTTNVGIASMRAVTAPHRSSVPSRCGLYKCVARECQSSRVRNPVLKWAQVSNPVLLQRIGSCMSGLCCTSRGEGFRFALTVATYSLCVFGSEDERQRGQTISESTRRTHSASASRGEVEGAEPIARERVGAALQHERSRLKDLHHLFLSSK